MFFCMYVIVAYSYIPVIINQIPFSGKQLDEYLLLNSIKFLHIFYLIFNLFLYVTPYVVYNVIFSLIAYIS